MPVLVVLPVLPDLAEYSTSSALPATFDLKPKQQKKIAVDKSTSIANQHSGVGGFAGFAGSRGILGLSQSTRHF